jgi:hypothetical protein
MTSAVMQYLIQQPYGPGSRDRDQGRPETRQDR